MALRELRVPEPKKGPEPCSICANTGLVVSEMAFKRCICLAGSLAAARSWDGVKIHPEDVA